MADPGGFIDDSNFDSFGGVENRWRIKHPVVTFFHLLFRTLALIAYLLCGWFSDSFIGSFVAIILLLSLDFWTVKNITGRIMTGLRWWNYINDSGESVWVFEASSEEAQLKLSKAEIQIFWAGLVASPVLWALLFFTALFSLKLKWVVLVIIGLALSGSNLVGYLRCRMGSTVSGAANQYLQQRVMANMMNMFKTTPREPTQTQTI